MSGGKNFLEQSQTLFEHVAGGLVYSGMNHTTLDSEKSGPRTEIIRELLDTAIATIRLAEITASDDSLWHLAQDCRNLYATLDKLLASKLEGE